jgi:hypothetical protein
MYLVNNLTGRYRREFVAGREYIVAPATLLVPGVLNGSKGPLFYPHEECRQSAQSWDQIPLTLYHPSHPITNQPLSALDDGVLARQGIGFVAKPRHRQTTGAETWFDVQNLKLADRRFGTNVHQRLQAGQPLELSTGLYTDNIPAPPGSNWKGRPYEYIARNYRPDHVAVLPDQVGACSLNDGCGVGVTANATGMGSIGKARLRKDDPLCGVGNDAGCGPTRETENDANFASEAQRKYMWWAEPDIAEKWAHGEHSSAKGPHHMPGSTGADVKGPEAKAARKAQRKRGKKPVKNEGRPMSFMERFLSIFAPGEQEIQNADQGRHPQSGQYMGTATRAAGQWSDYPPEHKVASAFPPVKGQKVKPEEVDEFEDASGELDEDDAAARLVGRQRKDGAVDDGRHNSPITRQAQVDTIREGEAEGLPGAKTNPETEHLKRLGQRPDYYIGDDHLNPDTGPEELKKRLADMKGSLEDVRREGRNILAGKAITKNLTVGDTTKPGPRQARLQAMHIGDAGPDPFADPHAFDQPAGGGGGGGRRAAPGPAPRAAPEAQGLDARRPLARGLRDTADFQPPPEGLPEQRATFTPGTPGTPGTPRPAHPADDPAARATMLAGHAAASAVRPPPDYDQGGLRTEVPSSDERRTYGSREAQDASRAAAGLTQAATSVDSHKDAGDAHTKAAEQHRDLGRLAEANNDSATAISHYAAARQHDQAASAHYSSGATPGATPGTPGTPGVHTTVVGGGTTAPAPEQPSGGGLMGSLKSGWSKITGALGGGGKAPATPAPAASPSPSPAPASPSGGGISGAVKSFFSGKTVGNPSAWTGGTGPSPARAASAGEAGSSSPSPAPAPAAPKAPSPSPAPGGGAGTPGGAGGGGGTGGGGGAASPSSKSSMIADAWTSGRATQNEEIENQFGGFMGGAQDDPHEASKSAAIASLSTEHGKAFGHAKRGMQASSDDDHAGAKKSHIEAAKEHEQAATDMRADDDHDGAGEHDHAAALHRKAASLHAATFNEEVKTMTKDQAIQRLVANSCNGCSQDDRELLAATFARMSDDSLRGMVVNTLSTQGSGSETVQAGDEEETGDEGETFTDERGIKHVRGSGKYKSDPGEGLDYQGIAEVGDTKLKKTKGKGEDMETNRRRLGLQRALTEEEFMAIAPLSVRNRLAVAGEIEDRERQRLCMELIANLRGEKHRQAMYSELWHKGIPELRRLVKLLPPKPQAIMMQNAWEGAEGATPGYLGGHGGPVVNAVDQMSPVAVEDWPPALNMKEISKEWPTGKYDQQVAV